MPVSLPIFFSTRKNVNMPGKGADKYNDRREPTHTYS